MTKLSHSENFSLILYLRTESGLLVKGSSNEEAVLFGGDLALAADPDAAGVADDLADHVLGCVACVFGVLHVCLPPADRPLGNVVRPDVGSHGRRRLAVTGKERKTMVGGWRHFFIPIERDVHFRERRAR